MSHLTRLLLASTARRAGRGVGGAHALRTACFPTSHAAGFTPPRLAHPAAQESCAAGVRVVGLVSGRCAPVRSFASAAGESAPKPKRRAAPKKKLPASSPASPKPRCPATPPSPLPFSILSTADGRDPFTAFTEAAGDAFASAFGPGGGGGRGGGGAWADETPSPSSSSSPLTAALAALTSPWLTPVQRQELADSAGAAWAAWGFPDPASSDPSGGGAGFGPDGRAQDPKAATVRAAVLDAALEHVVCESHQRRESGKGERERGAPGEGRVPFFFSSLSIHPIHPIL